MAGGLGARMAEYSDTQKPLVRVAGRTLMDFTLDSFLDAGINRVLIATHPANSELMDYVAATFPDVSFELAPTQVIGGTGGAVLALLQAAAGHDMILATSDSVLRKGSVRRMLNAIDKDAKSPVAHVLATTYQHDEKPIRLTTGPDRTVTSFTKKSPPTKYVFANVRWFSHQWYPDILRSLPSGEVQSEGVMKDSLIMEWLISRYPAHVTYSVEDPVFDIDRPLDIEDAESWLRLNSAKWRSLP